MPDRARGAGGRPPALQLQAADAVPARSAAGLRELTRAGAAPAAIRRERPGDRAAAQALLLAAFPGPEEADLVDRLRADGAVAIALVAEARGGPRAERREEAPILGHVVFSRMRAPEGALGLAPLAVAQEARRQGLGARLVRAGLAAARKAGWGGVFVLGDPGYYGRFGFSPGRAAGFASPYAGPHLMALELVPAGLPGDGRAAYAAAFDAAG